MKSQLIGKDPDAGKDGGQQEKGVKLVERMSWLGGITEAKDMNLGKLQEMARDRKRRHAVVHRVAKSQTQLGG